MITWDGAACGFGDFVQGERYLIYGKGNEKQGFFVSMCSRSNHISSADEDLKVLSGLSPNRDEPPVLKRFYAEPPLVELKGENVTGLELTLTWDEEDLKDFFKKKREQ